MTSTTLSSAASSARPWPKLASRLSDLAAYAMGWLLFLTLLSQV